MVGPDADIMAPAQVQDHGLGLAAGMAPRDLNFVRHGQQARRNPVEDRHAFRAGDADRLQFRDVFFHRLPVAPGPAGDDQFADGGGERLVAGFRLRRQGNLHAGLAHAVLEVVAASLPIWRSAVKRRRAAPLFVSLLPVGG